MMMVMAMAMVMVMVFICSADEDKILEVAVIVTDGRLRHMIEGPELVIHHPDEVLDNMNQWCIEHHGQSGLTDRVKASDITLKDAEDKVWCVCLCCVVCVCVSLDVSHKGGYTGIAIY